MIKLIEKLGKFQQVGSNSSRRQQQGSGLGLSLAKELIALQKGKIETEKDQYTGAYQEIEIPVVLKSGDNPVQEGQIVSQARDKP